MKAVAESSHSLIEHPESLGLKTIDDLTVSSLNSAPPTNNRNRSPSDKAFMERFKLVLRKRLLKYMRHHGSTEQAIIRDLCLSWDANQSGGMDPMEFRGAMCQV